MYLLRPTYPPGKMLISIITENRVYFLEDDRQEKKIPNSNKYLFAKQIQVSSLKG